MEQIKQTAVNWLEAIIENKLSQPMSANFKELFEQAKAMEKEQIVNAVDGFPLNNRNLEGEQYYEQTYGGNK